MTATDDLTIAAAQIQQWIRVCQNEHEMKCAETKSTALLPSRIIDVGSTSKSDIVLRESQSAEGIYICLSYCWGAQPFYKTTKENLENHRRLIRLEDLPPAFQLAIQLTRALGVRYIWIDAFCIIQNDAEDWSKEASRMADVYANCFLTISFSTASSPYEIYKLRDRKEVADVVYVHTKEHLPSENAAEETKKSFPLSQRAWAFQERLLSSKTVHLGPDELFWECQTRMACECEWENTTKHRPSFKTNYHDLLRAEPTTSDFQRSWHKVVQSYTARTLSFPDDRLPALSGVAESLLRLGDYDYLAGLWSHTLVEDLCWFRCSPETKQQGSTWRAPSWSWAAKDGRVIFSDAKDVSYTIIDYKVLPDGPSLTGKVRSGWIRLNASMMKVSVKLRRQAECVLLVEDWKVENFYPDAILDFATGKYFLALLTGYKSSVYIRQAHGFYNSIILRLLEGDELEKKEHFCEKEGTRYERVGFACRHFIPHSIAWPAEQETIIIV
jgi:hypothetical protein